MATNLTAQQIVEKWKTNASQSTKAYTDGVRGVKESPMEKAILQGDAAKRNYTRSIDDGTWAAGLRKVSLEEWKNRTATKGASRLAEGIAAGAGRFATYMAAFLPYAQSTSAQIQAMPKGTEQDSINRMIANMKAMKEFRMSRRGA